MCYTCSQLYQLPVIISDAIEDQNSIQPISTTIIHLPLSQIWNFLPLFYSLSSQTIPVSKIWCRRVQLQWWTDPLGDVDVDVDIDVFSNDDWPLLSHIYHLFYSTAALDLRGQESRRRVSMKICLFIWLILVCRVLNMISLTLMISRSSLLSLHCNLQNSLSPLYVTSMCRELSTTVNYRRSHHLVVRVRAAAVAHLVLVVAEAVVEITIHLVVWILMTVIPTLWCLHQTAGCFVPNLLFSSVMETGRQVQAVAVPARVDQDRVVANRVVANQAVTNRTRVTVDGDAGHFDDAVLRIICSVWCRIYC